MEIKIENALSIWIWYLTWFQIWFPSKNPGSATCFFFRNCDSLLSVCVSLFKKIVLSLSTKLAQQHQKYSSHIISFTPFIINNTFLTFFTAWLPLFSLSFFYFPVTLKLTVTFSQGKPLCKVANTAIQFWVCGIPYDLAAILCLEWVIWAGNCYLPANVPCFHLGFLDHCLCMYNLGWAMNIVLEIEWPNVSEPL